jgi:hypothetical protein
MVSGDRKIAIREDKISAVSRAINQRMQYQAAIQSATI